MLELGAALDVLRDPIERDLLDLISRLLAARPQDRERVIARDRVQPRLELGGSVVPRQGAKGGCEALLKGILGVLARAEHVPAESEQLAVIAVVDDLESRLVARIASLASRSSDSADNSRRERGKGRGRLRAAASMQGREAQPSTQHFPRNGCLESRCREPGPTVSSSTRRTRRQCKGWKAGWLFSVSPNDLEAPFSSLKTGVAPRLTAP